MVLCDHRVHQLIVNWWLAMFENSAISRAALDWWSCEKRIHQLPKHAVAEVTISNLVTACSWKCHSRQIAQLGTIGVYAEHMLAVVSHRNCPPQNRPISRASCIDVETSACFWTLHLPMYWVQSRSNRSYPHQTRAKHSVNFPLFLPHNQGFCLGQIPYSSFEVSVQCYVILSCETE